MSREGELHAQDTVQGQPLTDASVVTAINLTRVSPPDEDQPMSIDISQDDSMAATEEQTSDWWEKWN